MFGYNLIFMSDKRRCWIPSCWITAILFFIFTTGSLEQNTSGCGSCWTREQRKEYDIQKFKANILRKLRLSDAPMGPHLPRAELENIPSIRSMMRECELSQQQQRESSPGPTRSSRGCVGRSCPDSRGSNPDHYSMMMDEPSRGMSGGLDDIDDEDARTLVNVFLVPDKDRSSESMLRFSLDGYANSVSDLESGVLGLYLDQSVGDMAAYVHLSRYYRPDGYYGPMSRDPIRKRKVHLRPRGDGAGQWIQFNITHVIVGWLHQPQINLGLHIAAYDLQGRSLGIVNLAYSEHARNKPYLQLQFRDPDSLGDSSNSRLVRSRRSHSHHTDCDEMVHQSYCCRYKLMIEFHNFGWDSWILAPRSANVFYCSGECPYLYHSATAGSIVTNQAKQQGMIAGGPCCAPTTLSDLKLLYRTTNGTITQTVLPGVIVEKCGCW